METEGLIEKYAKLEIEREEVSRNLLDFARIVRKVQKKSDRLCEADVDYSSSEQLQKRLEPHMNTSQISVLWQYNRLDDLAELLSGEPREIFLEWRAEIFRQKDERLLQFKTKMRHTTLELIRIDKQMSLIRDTLKC